MNLTLFRLLSPIAAPAALLVPMLAADCVAQGDRIVWTDGTKTADARVQDFTAFEIKYQEKGSNQTKPADQVAEVEIARVDDVYRRGLNAPPSEAVGNLLDEARKRLAAKETFLAQFGFYEAARKLLAGGQPGDAFSVLDELVQAIPNSAYVPYAFRAKLTHYLSRGKEGARDAISVAEKYRAAATSQAFPQGFQLEAAFMQTLANAAAGTLSGEPLLAEMRSLLGSAEGSYPMLANRIKLQIAIGMQANDNLAEAGKIYDSIVDAQVLDQDTLARAWLGVGHVAFASADASNKEPYRTALMAFLRAYVNCPDASPELRAEATYYAATAAEKWGGPDWRYVQARMRGVLRRDFPDSTWASR